MSNTHTCTNEAKDTQARDASYVSLVPLSTALLFVALVSDCVYWSNGRAIFFQASEWLLGIWLATGLVGAADALIHYIGAGFVRLSRSCWSHVAGTALTLLLSLSNLAYRLIEGGGHVLAPVGIGLTGTVLCVIFAAAGLDRRAAADAPEEDIDDELEPLW